MAAHTKQIKFPMQIDLKMGSLTLSIAIEENELISATKDRLQNLYPSIKLESNQSLKLMFFGVVPEDSKTWGHYAKNLQLLRMTAGASSICVSVQTKHLSQSKQHEPTAEKPALRSHVHTNISPSPMYQHPICIKLYQSFAWSQEELAEIAQLDKDIEEILNHLYSLRPTLYTTFHGVARAWLAEQAPYNPLLSRASNLKLLCIYFEKCIEEAEKISKNPAALSSSDDNFSDCVDHPLAVDPTQIAKGQLHARDTQPPQSKNLHSFYQKSIEEKKPLPSSDSEKEEDLPSEEEPMLERKRSCGIM